MHRVVALVTALVLVGCGQSEPAPPTTAPTAAAPSPSLVSPSPAVTAMPTASPLAYSLNCGPIERAACEARAATIAAGAAARYPNKKLVSISFTAADGDSRATFDDGTAIVAIVN